MKELKRYEKYLFLFSKETMMKARLFAIGVITLLVACSNAPISSGDATITPDFVATDTANQIGTAIAAKSTENAIEALFTPTPTQGVPALKDLILTSAEANELANRWSNSPRDVSATDLKPEYCEIDCINLIWQGGTNGNSILDITLIRFGNREEAVSLIIEQKNSYVAANYPLITLPELVSLPEETVAFKGQSTSNTSAWGLLTRQGNVLLIIGINMPDLSEDENVLFLSLFADKQIQKLLAAGN